MILTDSLNPESVLININAASRDEAISCIVKHLYSNKITKYFAEINDAILERESRLSTGFGNGIAVPHAICDYVEEPVLEIATTKNRIDFNSLDNSPVQIIFILIIPTSKYELHLQMLSRISRICSNKEFLTNLLDCKTSAEIFKLFTEMEKQILVVNG